MTILQSNEKAVLVKEGDHYETWLNLRPRVGIVTPTDEDFGVWAWSHYTMERAEKYFGEISRGERRLIPMAAQL